MATSSPFISISACFRATTSSLEMSGWNPSRRAPTGVLSVAGVGGVTGVGREHSSRRLDFARRGSGFQWAGSGRYHELRRRRPPGSDSACAGRAGLLMMTSRDRAMESGSFHSVARVGEIAEGRGKPCVVEGRRSPSSSTGVRITPSTTLALTRVLHSATASSSTIPSLAPGTAGGSAWTMVDGSTATGLASGPIPSVSSARRFRFPCAKISPIRGSSSPDLRGYGTISCLRIS